jgi:hypothetical protein
MEQRRDRPAFPFDSAVADINHKVINTHSRKFVHMAKQGEGIMGKGV